MKKQMNKIVLISALTLAVSSNAYAGCEWTNGSLGQTVEATSKRLKQYAECKQGCQQLEANLAQTISLMNTSSECGVDVLTPKNRMMVEFFERRFKLMKKIKSEMSLEQIVATQQQPSSGDARETQMNISSEAYQALWTDDVVSQNNTQAQPVYQQSTLMKRQEAMNQQTAQAEHARRMQLAHQQRVEQQQLIQQQALTQLQHQRDAEARKRQVLLVQHQERIRQKQLQFERARALHLAQQKARQQRLER